MTRVLISGGWDLMHYNHVLTLQQAKALGDCLIVHCVSDERMKAKKGQGRPLMTLKERIGVLLELKCVDEVFSIPGEHYPLYDAIDACNPNVVVHNVEENPDVADLQEYCDDRGIKLSLTHRINEGASTSDLLNKMRQSVA